MDIESLQYFLTICEERRISEAAEKLFISKQALSTMIRKLEEEVGAVLFVRSRVGMELTPEGKILYTRATKLIEMWEQTKNEIEAVRSAAESRLSVGFGLMSIGYWNKELQERFIRENPSIELHIENDVSANLKERLDQGKIDLMITGVKTDKPEVYTRRLLRNLNMYMIMNEKDSLSELDVIRPENLAGRRLLFYGGSEWHMHAFGQFMKRQGIEIESATLPGSNYIVNIYKAASQNAILISNGMYRMVFPDLNGFVSRRLMVDEKDAPPSYGVYALTLREKENENKVRKFIEFLRRELPYDFVA